MKAEYILFFKKIGRKHINIFKMKFATDTYNFLLEALLRNNAVVKYGYETFTPFSIEQNGNNIEVYIAK